jgi:glutamate-ammonia-ligase adenylyltransferase
MAEGRLFEVDLRLRPSGEAGPAAAALSAFRHYHSTSAWTWEHMALTRARVIAGPPALRRSVEAAMRDALTAPRDPDRLLADVVDMRRRIAEQHKPRNRWNFKYVAGGLIDIEFAVQYLLLREAHAHPDLLTTETTVAIERLAKMGALSPAAASDLTRAVEMAWRVQGLIRLSTQSALDPDTAPEAIKAMLAREILRTSGRSAGTGKDTQVDFATSETILDSILAAARRRYDEIVATPVSSITTH